MNLQTTYSPRLLFLLTIALPVAGCAHTNRLAERPIAGKSAIFRTNVNASGSSWVAIESPVEGTTGTIAAAVGSILISDQGRRKLERAAEPDTIARAIGRGIQNAGADYLRLRPVASMADNPDLIVETSVDAYRIISASYGLAVSVEGRSRIIERATGIVVWENNETHTVRLTETWFAGVGGRLGSSAAGIFNAVKLLDLPEDQLRAILVAAGETAGADIGETLREDVAKLHER